MACQARKKKAYCDDAVAVAVAAATAAAAAVAFGTSTASLRRGDVG